MSEGLTFIPFMEHNQKYNEVNHVFLQVEGNDAQLEILKKLVEEVESSDLDVDDSYFEFGSGTIDEHAAEQLEYIRFPRGEVCACWGKLVLPFTEEEIPDTDDLYEKVMFINRHFSNFGIRDAFTKN
jgi:hypothetical protein